MTEGRDYYNSADRLLTEAWVSGYDLGDDNEASHVDKPVVLWARQRKSFRQRV